MLLIINVVAQLCQPIVNPLLDFGIGIAVILYPKVREPLVGGV